MKKRAANTFIKGLNTDRHPLSAANDELVDAMNVDITAVSKGYQFILQKREGNNIVTKLHDNIGVWNSETTYSAGTYILYLGSVYKSLQATNLGNTPVTSTAWWEVQQEVSAGLPEGYIPLALQEFNNIAYIISVNPTTGKTQLGTFPCPDYSQFVYVNGAPIDGAVLSIVGEYNADQDQADYAFALNSSSYSTVAIVDPVYSVSEQLYASILGPSVTLQNTGYNDLQIDVTTPNNVQAMYNSGAITSIVIPAGESRLITFQLGNSLLDYTAWDVIPTTVSFSSQSVSYTRTYTFSFKTKAAIYAIDDSGVYWKNAITFRYMNTNFEYQAGAVTVLGDGSCQTQYLCNFVWSDFSSSIAYVDKFVWDEYLYVPTVNMTGTDIYATTARKNPDAAMGESATAIVTITPTINTGASVDFTLTLYVDALNAGVQ